MAAGVRTILLIRPKSNEIPIRSFLKGGNTFNHPKTSDEMKVIHKDRIRKKERARELTQIRECELGKE